MEMAHAQIANVEYVVHTYGKDVMMRYDAATGRVRCMIRNC